MENNVKVGLIMSCVTWIGFIIFSLYLSFQYLWGQSIISFGLSWIMILNIYTIMGREEER
ncbi:hypothetical protein LCGC14_1014700 [marine sediment metagenome]|uniref:Uncharacterized protein n=1 Tax=marine sediment metagenome TaxID=412755 RepID=A0A0F9NKP9_9ZZZZ